MKLHSMAAGKRSYFPEQVGQLSRSIGRERVGTVNTLTCASTFSTSFLFLTLDEPEPLSERREK